MTDISKLLREAAEEILAADKLHSVSGERAGDLGQRLLAAAESLGEPVAYILEDDCGNTFYGPYPLVADGFGYTPKTLTPLYLAPQPAVPEGWKLVPVEPTKEMIQAAADLPLRALRGWHDRGCYRVMVAAAGDK